MSAKSKYVEWPDPNASKGKKGKDAVMAIIESTSVVLRRALKRLADS